MHTFVTNLHSLWQVTLAALIFGAGLPIVFAVGVRWWSATHTVDPDGTARRDNVAFAGALACFAIVLAAIITGILYTAKAFLSARLGIHLFGES
ncbi:hypothetical protein ACTD5D_05160 [Nocardia takedensis]|uniref:hypothetical protein n=1 Tax=Nocardia takedensis TaxID=259390 RepID=UPI0002DB9881|nr:hypothetical protein [Nocardia takedensis]